MLEISNQFICICNNESIKQTIISMKCIKTHVNRIKNSKKSNVKKCVDKVQTYSFFV